MSNTSTGKSGAAAERRETDRRVVKGEFAGEDRRADQRRSGDDRRQAARVRL
jgi:hypothetical protein